MNPARRLAALLLVGGVFLMEGYDINAMALAVPRLQGDMGLEAASFGWVFTALLMGLGIGAALLAPLGDKFGRRPLIVIGCIGVSLATFATATATTITEFLIWRLLTGITLGAVLPNCSALAAELAPPRLRATLMALVSAGIPLGLAIAGLTAPWVVAAANWEGLFLVPGIMAALLALSLYFVLESGPPRTMAEETAPAPPGSPQPPKLAEPSAVAASKWRSLPQFQLFAAPWSFPFFIYSGILAFNALNLYLLSSWLPTVLPQAGLSLDDAARVAGVVQLAGLGMGLVASLLIDRWKAGLTLLLMFGAISASFALVGFTAPDPLRWTLLLCVGVGGASAGGMALPALCAYLFPPRLLSSAVGMGVLVARLGAFAGPPLGGIMLASAFSPQAFLGVAAIPAGICALACLLIPAALAVRGREEQKAAGQAAA